MFFKLNYLFIYYFADGNIPVFWEIWLIKIVFLTIPAFSMHFL